MTKREIMEQKTQAILREVKRMEEVIRVMEKELGELGVGAHRRVEDAIERCEELHARLEDIRNIVEESRNLVERPAVEVPDPDLWL